MILQSLKILFKNPLLLLPSFLLFTFSLSSLINTSLIIPSVILSFFSFLGQIRLTDSLFVKGKVSLIFWLNFEPKFILKVLSLSFLFILSLSLTSLILNLSFELFKPEEVDLILLLAFRFLWGTFLALIHLVFYFSIPSLKSKGIYEALKFSLFMIKWGKGRVLILSIILTLLLSFLLNEPSFTLNKVLSDALRFLLLPLWFTAIYLYHLNFLQKLN